MHKIGLVVTTHSSQKIRPYGRDLLTNACQSFIQNCIYDFELIVIDNQSDQKLDNNSQILNKNSHYIYIQDQWKKGLTGAWNTGIKKAIDIGCDVILNSNDDLIFNTSINKFIEKIIENPEKDVSIFGPVTNGVNGPFIKIQHAESPDTSKSKEIVGDGWEGFVSGFFFGFTKNFYENFKYPDGDLFAEFDKFDKSYIHKYAGDCGKWGGQEMEICVSKKMEAKFSSLENVG